MTAAPAELPKDSDDAWKTVKMTDPLPERTDRELITAARGGDRHAFGVLWGRHSDAGRRVARSITQTFDADDLVSEAYLKIFTTVTAGGGPTGPFRPYLFVTIRNLAVSWARRRREGTLDEAEEIPDPRATDGAVLAALDSGLTLQAFRSLPDRWQEVLWFTEVDALNPAELAERMGLSANSVAALAYRAREGLRQAWIQAHIDTSAAGSTHQWVLSQVGKNARDGLSPRNKAKFVAHLAGCPACTVIAAEAVDTSSRFTSILLPLAVGMTGTAGLGAFLQHNATPAEFTNASSTDPDRPGRLRKTARRRSTVFLIPAAVVTVALVGGGISQALHRPGDDLRSSRIQPTPTATSEAAAPAGDATPGVTPDPSPTASATPRPETVSSPQPGSQASPSASPTPRLPSQTKPARTPGQSENSPAVDPTLGDIDTRAGILLPIISGTARAGAPVVVRVGTVAVTVAADGSGRWRTNPINVDPGTHAVTATADGVTTAAKTARVMAPVVSVATTTEHVTVTVRGAASTPYSVHLGAGSAATVTTNTAGTATTSIDTASGSQRVEVHAVIGVRTGAETTIFAP